MSNVVAEGVIGSSAHPGATLRVAGRNLESADRMSVGGVAVTFQHTGAQLTARVPAMLQAGPQPVRVEAGRCTAEAIVHVTRIGAVVSRTAPSMVLIDADTLRVATPLQFEASPIVQAAFGLDGRTLFTRAANGAVSVTTLADRRTRRIAAQASRPLAFAHSAEHPSRTLVAIPGDSSQPARLVRYDADTDAIEELRHGAPSVVGIATSLDGFRVLLLDHAGNVHAVDRPFDANASAIRWSERAGPVDAGATVRLPTPAIPRAPAEIAMADNGPITAGIGPIAAVFDATDTPAVIPMNSLTGRLGERVPVRGALGHMYFLNGDFVAFDARTPELIVADLTTLTGEVARIPLQRESPSHIARTTTAISLYVLAVLVLRDGDAGSPSADVVHFMDGHREPPVERGMAAVPGARGLVGIRGDEHAFLVWADRTVYRASAERPTDVRRWRLASDELAGDIAFIAVQ